MQKYLWLVGAVIAVGVTFACRAFHLDTAIGGATFWAVAVVGVICCAIIAGLVANPQMNPWAWMAAAIIVGIGLLTFFGSHPLAMHVAVVLFAVAATLLVAGLVLRRSARARVA